MNGNRMEEYLSFKNGSIYDLVIIRKYKVVLRAVRRDELRC